MSGLTGIPHADQVGRQCVHASAETRDNAPPDVRGSGIAVQEHDVGATASFAIRHVGIKRRNVANGGQVVVEGHGQLHAIMVIQPDNFTQVNFRERYHHCS